MRSVRFEVFDKAPGNVRLRFYGEDGQVLDRQLDAAQIDSFVTEIETGYTAAAPNLHRLGERLYQWLDGPTERWLADARNGVPGLAVHVDVEEKLRHLPWELMVADGLPLCGLPNAPLTPIRRVAGTARTIPRENRPLRLLFMACSPLDVEPVLRFEEEEAGILAATRKARLELEVEESGSLEGLRERVESFGKGHFDAFHLTGHAQLGDDGPIFVMEDEIGLRYDATAEQIAGAFLGMWPGLVFLSGCETGKAGSAGALPSLCEKLVRAGAPAVLGWALPVGDTDASAAATELYHHLAAGMRVDEAVARARAALFQAKSPDWNLLRLYADATPLGERVTPLNTKGRAQPPIRAAHQDFLDAQSKSEVCPRERFVGRRRAIQRSLRVLRSVQGEEAYHEGVLLHGMGGLGKSSLAARLCERMSTHERVVWVGRVDQIELSRVLANRLDDPEATALLNDERLTLVQRLRRLLEGPLAASPRLLVFDDFEQNVEGQSKGHPLFAEDQKGVLEKPALGVLTALLGAIRDTGSPTRVIVTCRYDLVLPGPATLHKEQLESFRGADLDKKLAALPAFAKDAKISADLREQATQLAAGNPRVLERLNLVLEDEATDHAAVLAKLEGVVDKFLEDTLLRTLLDLQAPECRKVLACADVFGLPVDREALAAAAGELPLEPHVSRAAAVGLIESVPDPASGSQMYFVSGILSPLLEGELPEADRALASERAAQHLYQRWWVEAKRASEEKALEIVRLGVEAKEHEVAVSVCKAVAARWVNAARYREAEALCRFVLQLGEDYRLLHALGRAEVVLGETNEALVHYERALALCPIEEDDETSEAALKERSGILFNLAALLAQQGDVARALELWNQVLSLLEKIGDEQGKAATLHQMAEFIAKQGDVVRAVELWNQALSVWEKIGNVRGKATTLHNMAWAAEQQGDVARALELWIQSLSLKEEIGDVKGKAETLHEMAGVIAQQGDEVRALELWNQALSLCEKIGDVRGKATTLHNMAWVIAQQGDVARALELWNQSLKLSEKIGDVQGKSATLHNMAWASAQQGDVARALELWNQSLSLKDKIGDVKGKAATLNNMAWFIAQQGDVARALELWNQSLSLEETLGNVSGQAATLANMAWAAGQQGEPVRERELNLQALAALVSVRAWLDATTVLGNLGSSDEPESLPFLAQAFWLVSRVGAPLEASVGLAADLFHRTGPETGAALYVAATTVRISFRRGEGHPKREELQQFAFGMLTACAAAREVPPERFKEWTESEGLIDPNRLYPALDRALEEIVGEDGWLFDRELVKTVG